MTYGLMAPAKFNQPQPNFLITLIASTQICIPNYSSMNHLNEAL